MKFSTATKKPYSRWLTLAAVIGVSIMTPIDGTALNIAITAIRHEFPVSLSLVAWVPLVYLVVIASFMLPLGRLGDIWGFRRLFLSGIAIFTVASAFCGLSPSLGWLIGARIVQGIGACLMMALSPAIITAVFPRHERGRALGFMGMGIAVGLVLGPTLGGFLIHWQGWRWIFFINLPIGLIGGLLCWRILPQLGTHLRRRIDWLGALLAMLMLGSLLMAATQGQDWGWLSPSILSLFSVSIISLVAFFYVELRHPEPMLELSIFKNPVFTGANIATMMNYLGQFTVIFLTPILLQGGSTFDSHKAEKAGMVLGTLPLAVLVLAPISGTLSDRLGTRMLAVTGELLIALGLFGLAIVGPSGNKALIIPVLILIGAGAGIFQSPNSSAIMGSVPRQHLGVGGSVLATMRNLGMAFGIAISTAVVSIGSHHYLQAHPGAENEALISGIRMAYVTGGCFALLGAITSAIRQDGISGTDY